MIKPIPLSLGRLHNLIETLVSVLLLGSVHTQGHRVVAGRAVSRLHLCTHFGVVHIGGIIVCRLPDS
jgi:hypothetical protein